MINVIRTSTNFEREKLTRPFGFKGGYLTELWQTVVKLESEQHQATGLATQSVLYGDAALFASCSEAAGNARMFCLTEEAVQLVKQTPFSDPTELLLSIFPKLKAAAKRITDKDDISENFILNSLISVDNAAWLLYARENEVSDFVTLLPETYRDALSHQNEKVAVMFQVPYGMPVSEIQDAVARGYFIIKLKTGFPGTQEEMLAKDMERLTQVHAALKNYRTSQTPDEKLIYTLDANGRYEKKETLQRYLQHAEKIGALNQILFAEEPFPEENTESVHDIPVRVAADESVHDASGALQRIAQGYSTFVLKGIAKTLSRSIAIAKVAHEHNIPCACADLTANPILIDWNKNLAARVAPFPELGMGMIETNGDMNYQNWEQMRTYHPFAEASWTQVQNGVFELTNDYYQQSGGIFARSIHYD
jgi:L-alanine-DL-glutamate epimerase-like enolase superfamily enzyme